MATKMTYVEAIDAVLALDLSADVREKMETLRKRLERKSTGERKLTAGDKEKMAIKDAILASMEQGKAYTIGDMMATFPALDGMTSQRVTALVSQMVGKSIQREMVKRKAYFSLMEQDAE